MKKKKETTLTDLEKDAYVAFMFCVCVYVHLLLMHFCYKIMFVHEM